MGTWEESQISAPVPDVFKMAAVSGISGIGRFRALVVEKEFVMNVLQRLMTPVRMHLQRRVCFKLKYQLEDCIYPV